MHDYPHTSYSFSFENRKPIKLKILRPNGVEEVIDVNEYREVDPFRVIPEVVDLTPNSGEYSHTRVTKDQFIIILRAVLNSQSNYKIPTIMYARTLIAGLGLTDAKNLVEAL